MILTFVIKSDRVLLRDRQTKPHLVVGRLQCAFHRPQLLVSASKRAIAQPLARRMKRPVMLDLRDVTNASQNEAVFVEPSNLNSSSSVGPCGTKTA